MAMNLADLAPLAIFLVIAGIVLTVGSDILTQVKSTQTTGSYAFNATGQGQEGLEKVADWMPTVGLIVAAAVVVGIVMTSFRA